MYSPATPFSFCTSASASSRASKAARTEPRARRRGYTPDAAQINAELVASRYATRAQRLGQELTGTEADKIDIRRVLPEGLAPAVAADQLDLVIEAMRGGKEAKPRRGASLLEFISSRGGIEDIGGDVAAMGGREWHKGKPGKRRLIREAERLIATDEEILQARQRQYLTALFADAEDAGMTEQEFAAYQESTGEARDAAFDALLYRTMQTIRQARTKAWKDEEAGVRADVTSRINRRPEFRALHLLRTGKFLDSPDADPSVA